MANEKASCGLSFLCSCIKLKKEKDKNPKAYYTTQNLGFQDLAPNLAV